VIKPFPNLLYQKKDRNLNPSKKTLNKNKNVKSKPMIIFGFIISFSSIILLLLTIKSKFG
jgi:hypothetical protein